MPSSCEIIKRRVRELRPYSLRPDRAPVKLNQNESPWDTPHEVKQETLRRVALRPWSRYPDFAPHRLHEKLARHCGWIAEGIIAGNGSNELIQALLMATISDGKRVLISEPTFALYRQIATILGADVISVPPTPDLNYDARSLVNTIQTQRPEITIICSPNNPTGCLISRPDLVSILKASSGLVVIDEAYGEFAGDTVVPLLQQHSNLIVLRTFSKAMALAGLRIGYLLAGSELVTEISKAMLPYYLNLVSQTAAEVALEMYNDKLKPVVELIRRERERLFAELQTISGVTPLRSHANFILVRSSLAPARVYQELLRRKLLIRDVSSYPLLQDCFRVSVGTPEENDLLTSALREIFGRSKPARCEQTL